MNIVILIVLFLIVCIQITLQQDKYRKKMAIAAINMAYEDLNDVTQETKELIGKSFIELYKGTFNHISRKELETFHSELRAYL